MPSIACPDINSPLISFYVPSFRGGGAEKAWVQLANQFTRQGFRVDFIVAQKEGPYLKLLSPSIRVIDFKKSNVFKTVPDLVGYLNQHRPTYLLSALNHVNLVSLVSKNITFVSTKNVISIQNYLSLHAKNSISFKDKIMPLLAKFIYPTADILVAVSDGVALDLAEITGRPLNKFNVISNPIVHDEIFSLSQQSVDHPWFGLDGMPVVIGMGRLVKQKNFSLLIQAFKLLRNQYPCHLVILGEGEERSQLQSLIDDLDLNEDVSLPGFVQNPYSYMAKASLFVLSSLWEGFGNVIAEALACGTSVVSTDCQSGPAEILDHGKYGALVPINDVEKLADAMIKTLANPFPADILVERSYHYSSEQIFKQYCQLLFPDSKTEIHSL